MGKSAKKKKKGNANHTKDFFWNKSRHYFAQKKS
jgi:hypothetical protein